MQTSSLQVPKRTALGTSLKLAKNEFFGAPLLHAALSPVKDTAGVSLVQCVMEPPSKQVSSLSFTVGPPVHSIPTLGATPSGSWQTVPDMWRTLASRYGDRVALFDPHKSPQREVSYKELEQLILDFAEGLRVLGLKQGQCVSLFADNSHRWLVADQGIMMTGASDAVRGVKAPPQELFHITTHSDSSALVVENRDLLAKLAPKLRSGEEGTGNLKFAVLLWGSCASTEEGGEADGDSEAAAREELGLPFPVYTYKELLGSGHTSRVALAAAEGPSGRSERPHVRSDDIATLVYTSGTTGNPKAVMLTHSNLLHQISAFETVLAPQAGDTVVSLLPPWHMYERSAEYYTLSQGVRQVYSGVKSFKEDLATYPPDYFIAVPLVFKILYEGVQKKLAESKTKKAVASFLLGVSHRYMDARRVLLGRDLASVRREEGRAAAAAEWVVAAATLALLLPLHLLAGKLVYSKIHAALGIRKAAISGGGSLPAQVDKFFEAVGIQLLVGYGLTETSPVLTVRSPHKNILGTVGVPLPATEVKVVDEESGKVLPAGSLGIVKVRGPQVMKGYYKNPAATVAAIDREGWFDSGDLGWLAPAKSYGAGRSCGGELVLTGRAKDTIVLSNGENVEPTHIEEAAVHSLVVQQIMLVGQDQKRLGALVVPDKDELRAAAAAAKARSGDSSAPTEEDLRNVVRSELNRCLNEAGCTYAHERIGSFVLIDEPFSTDNLLLTPTMKMRRPVIADRYQEEIASLFRN